ncbi:MAG: beta-lactamase family protein [Vicinamibacterales bacterium]|nr:beta-lactamase family protein [Vicinamibacterales bacterium]
MGKFACLLVVGFASVASGQARPVESPVPAALEPAVKAATELPRLHSLLVSQRGTLILERYFNGRRPSSLSNIKSASKSVISALVGAAIHRGLIKDVHDPIAAYFPEQYRSVTEAAKRTITIEDLLTMRSGLESTSNRNYGAWVQSGNWVKHALMRPLVAQPGTAMEYSTGNSHLLSAILTKASGRSTWQFAQDVLGQPLGFRLEPWPRDPQGIYFGGNDMLMSPRQMLAFGEMYLNEGRAGAEQVVPEKWVNDSFAARGRSRISGREYGYGWWMREMAGRQAYYAWGFGGQFVVLVPDLQLVVVSTSASTADDDRRAHRRTVDEIIEQLIVARLGGN